MQSAYDLAEEFIENVNARLSVPHRLRKGWKGFTSFRPHLNKRINRVSIYKHIFYCGIAFPNIY